MTSPIPKTAQAPFRNLAFEALADLPILSREEMTTGYYIRINAEDQTGVLADVTTI